MSRRRNVTRQTEERLCSCEKPARDDAFVCDTCLDTFTTDLRDLTRPVVTDHRYAQPVRVVSFVGFAPDVVGVWSPWCRWPRVDVAVTESYRYCPWPRVVTVERPSLWDEVRATLVGERGVDYRGVGGASGGSTETGIDLNDRASDVALSLARALRALVVACMDHRLASTHPEGWQPRAGRQVPAMAEWLSWRVDAIALHPETAGLLHVLRRAIASARWVIDKPATRQNLGPCLVVGCDGRYSAVEGADFATCDVCSGWIDAEPLRDWVRAEHDDQLYTAGEIARLSTYLGLQADRDQVRKRINQWHRRDRIQRAGDAYPDPATAGPCCTGTCRHPSCRACRPEPLFRFGEVYELLRPLAAESTDTA